MRTAVRLVGRVRRKGSKRSSFARAQAQRGIIPLPPVFARSVVESKDCRAIALAKADNLHLARRQRIFLD
jgi:hypothetical protein